MEFEFVWWLVVLNEHSISYIRVGDNTVCHPKFPSHHFNTVLFVLFAVIRRAKWDLFGSSRRSNVDTTSSIMSHVVGRTKPYSCRVCGKQFKTRQVLKNHEVIHTGARPYGCDICGRTFNRSHVLKDHLRTHTGEKPYHCNKCGKQFAYKSNMTSHMLICKGI